MCRSQPRFSMYDTMSMADSIPFYETALSLNADGTDADPSQILNPTMRACDQVYDYVEDGYLTPGNATGPSAVPSSKPKARRQATTPFMPGQLIVSNITDHSAADLCNSDTSQGPDFVSTVESLFCDMTAKQLYPLCSDTQTDSCFDLTTNSLVPAASVQTTEQIVTGSQTTTTTSYNSVVQWS